MFKELFERIKQKHRTVRYPEAPPALPERFQGRPVIDSSRCTDGCGECIDACPTNALSFSNDRLSLDMGKCIFCGECASCGSGAVSFTGDYRLAGRKREELIISGNEEYGIKLFNEEIRALFGRSLKLRQVSAGGCNACEADLNVLNTVVFDLGRFGIQFVASPRHADGIVVTGPVSGNMRLALEKTYKAVPAPKIVIAVGACAISGGIFAGHDAVHNGADSVLPVDLYIPGCPPNPYTILHALLGLFREESFRNRVK